MKNKGFSMVEVMVVVGVALGLLGIISGVFITGRNSWSRGSVLIDLQAKSRLAMDRMVRELSSSAPNQVSIDECGNCVGQMINFKVPVAIDGSIYNAQGDIIWGADGNQGWTIQYYADANHNLVRRIPENVTPEGACCAGTTCYIATQASCDSSGHTYQNDGSTCNPDPCAPVTGACCMPGRGCRVTNRTSCSGAWYSGQGCSPDPCNPIGDGDTPFGFLKKFLNPTLCFAQDNETILATDIQELYFVGTPAANPHTVKITINAQKIFILGEPIEVELSSAVSFRNK